MKMPPAARKAYMAFLLIAVGAYICAISYRGYTWLRKKQEERAILATQVTPLATPLARAIQDYATAHQGALPRATPLTQLLSPDTAPLLEDPALHIKWTTGIDNLRQCVGGRSIILWIDDARYPTYASAIVTDGTHCTPEIVPRIETGDLNGDPAILK